MVQKMHQKNNVGVGVVPPVECYNSPGFEQAWINAMLEAGQQASNDAEYEELMLANLNQLCPVDTDPVTQFKDYETGDLCSASSTIRAVQLATNNPDPDGIWGPDSQKYLDASGMAYTDIVPGCTGAIPSVGGGGGGGGGGGVIDIIDTTDTEQTNLYWGLPLWAWLAIGAGSLVVGGTGAYFAFRKDKTQTETETVSRELALGEPRARIKTKKMRRKVSVKGRRNSKGQFVSKKIRYSR